MKKKKKQPVTHMFIFFSFIAAPSAPPKLSEDVTNTTLHGQYRDVILHWKVRVTNTWIFLHYVFTC